MPTQVQRAIVRTALLTGAITLGVTTFVSAPAANADQTSFQQCLKAGNIGSIYDPRWSNCCTENGGQMGEAQPGPYQFPMCTFPFVPQRTAPAAPSPAPGGKTSPPSGIPPFPR